MGYKKSTPLWLTVFFIVLFLFGTVQERSSDSDRFVHAKITSNGVTETVSCWKSEDGSCYIFLPSYANLAETVLNAGKKLDAKLEGNSIAGGYCCSDLSLNTPYVLTYVTESENCETTLTIVKSANVPTIYIDVASSSMEYIHADKEHKESGTMRLYSADGELDYQGTLASIKGRGNGTWAQNKKPYNLTFASETDLLGMGAATRWVLMTNGYDTTYLRNKMAYDLAEKADMLYSPDCEWVDLYLNGEYNGLYYLCERNEIHSERVNLTNDSRFLVSLDHMYRFVEKGQPYIQTESMQHGSAFRIHETSLDAEVIQNILQSAENSILSKEGIDPATGKSWTELLDVDSWIKKYLLEETLGNVEAGIASQYFFYTGNEEHGLLYAGPIWDYDHILGNKHWHIRPPNSLVAARPHLLNSDDKPYYAAMYSKPEFYTRMVRVYETLFRPLLLEYFEEGLLAYEQQICSAAAQDAIRWNMVGSTESVEELRQYLKERIAFLDSLWLEENDYCMVQISNGTSAWACYAVKYGECLPENLKWQVKENKKWYNMETNEPFDLEQPVWGDLTICLRSTENSEEQFWWE